ncbi:hypothetical protein E2C01_078493 [Portunus trituberculatus]|uniref:Uncharacterized protein n=1 Tax=Portunus trituberculatus TaxID=210409 RepID=A0A5B7ISX6_PORTR|nr:hypothetical protein [Portunus trituberculatus]
MPNHCQESLSQDLRSEKDGQLPRQERETAAVQGTAMPPHLEYAALSWMSCAATQRRRLDSIQRRALLLVDGAFPPHPEHECPLNTLEQRRDVAAIVVFHKAQMQKMPHLAGLRHPLRVSTRSTRTVVSDGDAVEVQQSQGCQHQRTFAGRVSRMWNLFTAAVPHAQEMNTHSVKLMAHKWRQTLPTL